MGHVLKQLITTLLIAAWLAGCAQNQTNQSTETANQSAAESLPPLEKKCKYERSNRAGSRLHRVCRFVDPSQTADNKK